jgi:hypothetical protein
MLILYYGENHNNLKNQHKYYAILEEITTQSTTYHALYGRCPGYGTKGTTRIFPFKTEVAMRNTMKSKKHTYTLMPSPVWLLNFINTTQCPTKSLNIYDDLEAILFGDCNDT